MKIHTTSLTLFALCAFTFSTSFGAAGAAAQGSTATNLPSTVEVKGVQVRLTDEDYTWDQAAQYEHDQWHTQDAFNLVIEYLKHQKAADQLAGNEPEVQNVPAVKSKMQDMLITAHNLRESLALPLPLLKSALPTEKNPKEESRYDSLVLEMQRYHTSLKPTLIGQGDEVLPYSQGECNGALNAMLQSQALHMHMIVSLQPKK